MITFAFFLSGARRAGQGMAQFWRSIPATLKAMTEFVAAIEGLLRWIFIVAALGAGAANYVGHVTTVDEQQQFNRWIYQYTKSVASAANSDQK